MKRPLWCAGLTVLITLIAASFMGTTVSLYLAAVAGAVALLWLLARHCFRIKKLKKRIAVIVVIAAAAFLRFGVAQMTEITPLLSWNNKQATITAEVWDKQPAGGSGYTGYTVCITDGHLPVGTRLMLWLPRESERMVTGDIVSGTVQLEVAELTGSTALARKADRTVLTAFPAAYSAEDMQCRKPTGFSPRALIGSWQSAACCALTDSLAGDSGALAAGICFGYTDALSQQATRDFRAAGLSHVIAVSGMHMTLLSQALLWLLRRFRKTARVAPFAAILFTLFFILLTGMTASVLRAGIMNIIWLLGMGIQREADTRNSLGGALLLLLIINPFAVGDAGLLLSFGSTAGLLLILPCFMQLIERQAERFVRYEPVPSAVPDTGMPDADVAFRRVLPLPLRLLRRLLWMTAVTVSAVFPVLPLLAWLFGTVSPLAPLANLLCDFAASGVLLGGCLAALLSAIPLLAPLAQAALLVTGLLCRYLLCITRWLASLFPNDLPLRESYAVVWITGAVLLILLGWRLLRWKGVLRATALSVMIICFCVTVSYTLSGNAVTYTVVQAKKSTAVLVEYGGRAGLMLTGDHTKAVTRAILLLRSHGITELSFLLLPDDGECARGLPLLLRDMTVRQLLLSPDSRYKAYVEALGVPALQNSSARFWDDAAVSTQDGWTQMTVAGTRLLVGGDQETPPPAAFRSCSLLVCQSTETTAVQSVTATAVVAESGEPTAITCKTTRVYQAESAVSLAISTDGSCLQLPSV